MTSFESSPALQSEVAAALEVDDTVLGCVYRATRDGKSEAEMAEEQGTKYKNFVWNYRRQLKALLDGNLPTAPSVARQSAGALRGFIWRHSERLSSETQAELERRAVECTRRSANSDLREKEDEELDEKARIAEKLGVTGIYVYTLPHYHNHPMQPSDLDPTHDRTLMKVGKSDSDVIKRFRDQVRNTALPEDPRLLRIYVGVEGKGDVEGRFHRLLAAADHRRNRGKAAGSEWFLTSLTFLDALAQDMGLAVHFALDAEVEPD